MLIRCRDERRPFNELVDDQERLARICRDMVCHFLTKETKISQLADEASFLIVLAFVIDSNAIENIPMYMYKMTEEVKRETLEKVIARLKNNFPCHFWAHFEKNWEAINNLKWKVIRHIFKAHPMKNLNSDHFVAALKLTNILTGDIDDMFDY